MDTEREDDVSERVYYDGSTPKVMAFFLLYSLAMFSLPFAAFYGTQHYLKEILEIDGFANIVWSVMSAVLTVWGVIILYAFHGYREDVDPIVQRSNLNLKKE